VLKIYSQIEREEQMQVQGGFIITGLTVIAGGFIKKKKVRGVIQAVSIATTPAETHFWFNQWGW